MVYLKRGTSKYTKGNLTRVDLLSDDPAYNIEVKVIKGTPQTIVSEGKVGRPRIVPYEDITPSELKEELGVTIKGMSAEQRRAYNRLAQRQREAKEQVIEDEGITAESFKKQLDKKIKDMTKEELREYNRLNKIESRLLNK